MCMCFELSSMLMTVAGLSASFVAIIGGFIASKLIAVNGERDAIENRLQELQSEIALKECLRDEHSKLIEEDDAISFICDHIVDVVNIELLSKVYCTDEDERISEDDLLPYWDKAIELARRFQDLCKEPTAYSDRRIPVALANEVRGHTFEYEVCSAIAEEVFGVTIPMTHTISVELYNNAFEKREALDVEIAALKIHKEQCAKQRNALKKPKGMKCGLTIFSLFSLFNILVPLTLSTVPLKTVAVYNGVRALVIGTLTVGLIATFIYLAWLLHWKPIEEDK